MPPPGASLGVITGGRKAPHGPPGLAVERGSSQIRVGSGCARGGSSSSCCSFQLAVAAKGAKRTVFYSILSQRPVLELLAQLVTLAGRRSPSPGSESYGSGDRDHVTIS